MGSSILIAFIVTAAFACISGQTLNVTSSPTDYYFSSRRDMQNDCDGVQTEISAVDSRYADELSVIKLQHKYVLDEIQNVNTTYTEQQTLSLKKKHCIQKSLSQFSTYAWANTQLNSCYQKAASLATTLTKSASTNLVNARNYPDVQLQTRIHSCSTSYSSPVNQTLLENCYIKEVSWARDWCNDYLSRARVNLVTSLYDASVAMDTVVKCSFAVERTVLMNIGKAQQAIEICEAALPQNVTSLAVAEVAEAGVPLSLKKLIGP